MYLCSRFKTYNTMKKHLLLLVFAIAASVMSAQNNDMYSLMYHDVEYVYSLRGLMQQRDSDFIINTQLVEDTGNYNYISLGYMFYKMSPTTLTLTDSLFIADTTMSPACSFAPNLLGEGNIRTFHEYHRECDSTFLRISHFPDDDLHADSSEDVVVPLCEGYVSSSISMVDSRGDLVLQYYKDIDVMHYDEYAARFDLNGTLKCQTLLHENLLYGVSQLQVLQESPLKYYQYGPEASGDDRNLIVYVVDTLFHKNPIIINCILSEVVHPYFIEHEYLNIDGSTQVIPVGGDDILVASKYLYEPTQDPMEDEYGVVVAKYDIRTMQQKGYIVFNDYPGIYRPAECLGIKMMTDGTVYFLYKETGYPEESFIAVKMDTDLNVEWKRFCKTDDIIIFWWFEHSTLNKDGQGEEKGIAWAGYGLKPGNTNGALICLLLNHDGTVGMNEGGIEVRPYAFYPNPVKEQLHMQFSPDVQPAQVELYDLQGRLVRTQSKAFESIDMSQLPAGTYTLRVTLEDGKSYSDKVVKE